MTVARMSKEELEELQSAETWEGTGAATQVNLKPARAVVSVAFSREDFETIVDYAKQHGMKTSEFIRRAALDKAMPKHREPLVISVTGGVYTEYVSVSAPRAKTEVSTTPGPAVYATA
jgi:pectin methylesterase-like acyl-CoA thioesterase